MTREEQAQYICEKLMENPEFRKAFAGAIIDAVIEVVTVIQSLQQEPCKVGYWISNAEDDLKISEYTCSNCKGLSDMDSDYCPKCGAKMWR